MKKGRDVWLNIGRDELHYHERQYTEPYRSTVSFIEFLKKKASFTNNSRFSVLDVGTGGGANLFWLAKEFPQYEFTGIDISSELIDLAKEQQKDIPNTNYYAIDLNNIYTLGKFDYILSFQLLSWLSVEEANKCLELQFSYAKRGIAMTSLFCEDDLDYEVKINDYYNIYSIPRLRELATKADFSLTYCERFEIDRDLPKCEKGLGTYTLKLQDGKRLQFSGCMNLPWHFLLFEKNV